MRRFFKFKMTIHVSSNEPNLRDRGILIPPYYKVVNRIRPKVIIADKSSKPAAPVSYIL